MYSTRINEFLQDVHDDNYVSDKTWLMCRAYAVASGYDVTHLPENGWY